MAQHPEHNSTYLVSEDFVGEAKACLGEGRETLVSSGKAEVVSCSRGFTFRGREGAGREGFVKVVQTWPLL